MTELDAALREMQEAVRSAVRERKRRTESKPDAVEHSEPQPPQPVATRQAPETTFQIPLIPDPPEPAPEPEPVEPSPEAETTFQIPLVRDQPEPSLTAPIPEPAATFQIPLHMSGPVAKRGGAASWLGGFRLRSTPLWVVGACLAIAAALAVYAALWD